METEEILNISIPVYLNSLYTSSRRVEGVELLLELYTSLGSFFNSVVADAVRQLIEDGRLMEYQIDANSDDDEIVTNYLARAFETIIDERRFGSDILDDCGYSSSELKRHLKLMAYYLVEVVLEPSYNYICGEASDRGKRLSRVHGFSAVREVGDCYGLPTQLIIEAQIGLDNFRRIR